MSTYEAAQTRYITIAGNTRLAYRLFGLASSPTCIPLFLHIHFRGTMDHWDPSLLNPLAAQRPILLIDSSGVGRSNGSIPPTYAGWASVIAAAIRAIGFTLVDVLGFSMGGFTAQLLKLNHPELVRRLILAGTGPSAGEGVVQAENWTISALFAGVSEEECADGVKRTFFPRTDEGQAAAKLYWERVLAAHPPPERAPFVSKEAAKIQMSAGSKYLGLAKGDFRKEGSYDRLGEIRGKVLVINGDDDIVVPTENSLVLWRRMTNARVDLHLFARSGHGFLYQHADSVAALINRFLNEDEEEERTPLSRL